MKKSKIISLILAIALIVSMIPAIVVSADAVEIPIVLTSEGEVQIIPGVLKSGSITFNKTTDTLTFNNVSANLTNVEACYVLIDTDQPVTVEFKGENTLTCTADSVYYEFYGFYSNCDTTIGGDGTLNFNITAPKLVNGFYANNSLTFNEDVTVNINVKTTSTANANHAAIGIYALDDLVNNGTLNITAISAGEEAEGIMAECDFENNGTITINAEAKTEYVSGYMNYYGADFKNTGSIDITVNCPKYYCLGIEGEFSNFINEGDISIDATGSTDLVSTIIYGDSVEFSGGSLTIKENCIEDGVFSTYGSLFVQADSISFEDCEIDIDTNIGLGAILLMGPSEFTNCDITAVNACTEDPACGILATDTLSFESCSVYATGNTAAIASVDGGSGNGITVSDDMSCLGDLGFKTAIDEITTTVETFDTTISALYFTDAPLTVFAIDEEFAKTVLLGVPDYEIIKGANQEYVFESGEDFTVTSNAPYALYEYTLIDGEKVPEKYVTVKEGSTIVTIKADYMDNLDTGKHTIEIVSTNGSAKTDFTVVTPHTDAAVTYALASALIVFTLFSGSYIVIKKRAELN